MLEADTGAFTHYKRQMLRKTLPPFMNASPKTTTMSPSTHFRPPPPMTLTLTLTLTLRECSFKRSFNYLH